MAGKLEGKKVAIVATEGVEQIELTEPRKALEDAGAEVTLVSVEAGDFQGFNHLDKADTFTADKAAGDVSADDFDALMLPGGVANPDNLRTDEATVSFIRGFAEAKKPIAAICHAPWTLIEAGIAEGRKVTSWPSLQTDLRNAGADWVDEEVVVDQGLVTSRNPDDLPAFNEKMVEEFCDGQHEDAPQPATAGAAVS
jgi:protease I